MKTTRTLGVLLASLLLLAACTSASPEDPLPTATATALPPLVLAPTDEPPAPPVAAEISAGESAPPIAETAAETLPAPAGEEPPPPGSEAAAPAPTLTHTVQAGETLLGLALHYGLPLAALQLENGMGASTALWAGQSLSIPPAGTWTGASPFWAVYEIQQGDTLLAIANRYGLDFVSIVAVNELTDADTLSVGQPLVLPLEAPAELALASAGVPAPAPTAPPAPVAAAVATEPPPTAPTIPPAEAPPVAAPPAGSTAPPEIAGWPAEVFALINAERAAAGLSPFAWNDTLARAAYLHGLDCQQRGSCNHTGSDGSTVKMRVTRAGYPTVGAAECIVYSRTPAQAVHWWMDEVPPNDWHRRTILSTWVTEIGIAVVPNHLGSYYFIANFGRPQ